MALQAGEMAPLVQGLPCEHKDPSLIPSSYEGPEVLTEKPSTVWLVLVTSVREMETEALGSLSCQPHLFGEFQAGGDGFFLF